MRLAGHRGEAVLVPGEGVQRFCGLGLAEKDREVLINLLGSCLRKR